jgi:hypothetical protein
MGGLNWSRPSKKIAGIAGRGPQWFALDAAQAPGIAGLVEVSVKSSARQSALPSTRQPARCPIGSPWALTHKMDGEDMQASSALPRQFYPHLKVAFSHSPRKCRCPASCCDNKAVMPES